MNSMNHSLWRWTVFGLPILTAHATILTSLSQLPETSHSTEETGTCIDFDITESIFVPEETTSEAPIPTESQVNDIEQELKDKALVEKKLLEETEERQRQETQRLSEKAALEKAEALLEKQRQLANEKAQAKAQQEAADKKLAAKKAAEQKARDYEKRKLAAEKLRKAALVKKIVKQPSAIKRTPPRYPRTLQRKGVEGSVKLALKVTASGSISSISISQSSGHSAFDSAALSAVKKWTYNPAKNALGQQIACSKKETITFRLQ